LSTIITIMSGRGYDYRGGQNQNPRWEGNYVRNSRGRGRNIQRSVSWQNQQQHQQRLYSPQGSGTDFYKYGRREAAPRREPSPRIDVYVSPPRERTVRPARPQFKRVQPQLNRVRSRGGFSKARGGGSGFRKPARSNQVRRNRPRKRFNKDVSHRREKKRQRISSVAKYYSKSTRPSKPNRRRLQLSTLILASGVPGEATEHEFLDVKFLSHPFIRPFVSMNVKTGMMNVEVVGITRYGPEDARDRCEFSILKHDITSIIAFEGDTIPEDIARPKIDQEKESDDGIKTVDAELEQDGLDINPDTMPSEELRLELKKRGLESRGLKGELIQRLKSALEKEVNYEGALKSQTVDPSALFVHVDSDEEEHSAEQYGKDLNNADYERNSIEEQVDEMIPTTHDQKISDMSEHDQDQELLGNHDEKEPNEEIIKPVKLTDDNVLRKEFAAEECYVYVSGIRGKVRKKALVNTFSEFGKVVSIKQVARKCRIQFDSPAAVNKLVSRTSPVLFNNHTLTITKDLAIVGELEPKRNEKDKYTAVESMDTDDVSLCNDADKEHDSEQEVETGRGATKRNKKVKETDEEDENVNEKVESVSKKRTMTPKKKKNVLGKQKNKMTSKTSKVKLTSSKGRDGKKNISSGLHSPQSQGDEQFIFDDFEEVEVGNDLEPDGCKSTKIPVSGGQSVVDDSLLDFTDEPNENPLEPDQQPIQNSEGSLVEVDDVEGEEAEEREQTDEVIGIEDRQSENEDKVPHQTSPPEPEQLTQKDSAACESGAFEMARESDGDEESHYIEKVGLKNGLSLIEHLKLQSNLNRERVSGGDKLTGSADDQTGTCSVEITAGDEKQQIENFTTSYRVVIALKRGARILRRSDTLLKREAVDKARIVILEFALTPKNMEPKKVVTTVTDGPLRDLVHGGVWPESGNLSFKRTVSKVLGQIQVARTKEKSAYTVDALFEENKVLKAKRGDLEEELQKLRDEVGILKKNMKKARGFLA